jgi:hypothetical protein
VVVVNATDATDAGVAEALTRCWRASVQTHAVGKVAGRSRRDAVRAALAFDCDRVLYCDLDHVIRWIESSPDEVRAVATDERHDWVIVGRTAEDRASRPQVPRDR